jgi:hypothetical protein
MPTIADLLGIPAEELRDREIVLYQQRKLTAAQIDSDRIPALQIELRQMDAPTLGRLKTLNGVTGETSNRLLREERQARRVKKVKALNTYGREATVQNTQGTWRVVDPPHRATRREPDIARGQVMPAGWALVQ